MDIRAYSPQDREACLAVFDSNTPRFFLAIERSDFEKFLDTLNCSYFVMEHDGAVVGCGGYVTGEDLASLVWGMVRIDLHKLGFGRFLPALPAAHPFQRAQCSNESRLGTSQHSAAFFQKQGFKVVSIEKDGYAPGIDRIEMIMKLSVCP